MIRVAGQKLIVQVKGGRHPIAYRDVTDYLVLNNTLVLVSDEGDVIIPLKGYSRVFVQPMPLAPVAAAPAEPSAE